MLSPHLNPCRVPLEHCTEFSLCSLRYCFYCFRDSFLANGTNDCTPRSSGTSVNVRPFRPSHKRADAKIPLITASAFGKSEDCYPRSDHTVLSTLLCFESRLPRNFRLQHYVQLGCLLGLDIDTEDFLHNAVMPDKTCESGVWIRTLLNAVSSHTLRVLAPFALVRRIHYD
jgi:hypothetical protein